MAAIVQCPNCACGQHSHLADDPLGRIFRCPHCRTRLPAASALAADAGWTTIIGAPRSRYHEPAFKVSPYRTKSNPGSVSRATGSGWVSPLLRSTEPRDKGCEENHHLGRLPLPVCILGLGPDESGELLIEPVSQGLGSGSAWKSSSASTLTAAITGRAGAHSNPSGSVSEFESMLGRFHILEVLGQGEHARVFRAYDSILERDIALKIPNLDLRQNAKALNRFLGEAKALARLRHPRIVSVHEAGCIGEQHYIAMALVEGHSLAERLIQGPLAIHTAVEIIAELAEALAYAHSQGVIHRDVKPANVRLDDEGAAYLMDFGIAYRPGSGELPLPPGLILGTPAYLAPEQARGGQVTVLPTSDQYSLGIVFYELLCGRTPFCGPPSYVLFHTIHHAPPSPRTFAPLVPRSLAAICLKSLAKSPDGRYRNCQDMADDLRLWLRGETPRAYRHPWAQRKG
jgi:tRNA A-37 threonylcarbamoyl transferase component Bud32